MAYIIHASDGPVIADSLSIALELRDICGGHITEEHTHRCPGCHVRQSAIDTYLGTLGTTDGHRCRYCGITWTCESSREG